MRLALRTKCVLVMLASILLGLIMPAGVVWAQQTVTVASNPTYVPFESRDAKTGKMVGYDMDVLHAVVHEAGFDYKLKLINFDGIIPALLSHSVDMAITGMTITKARAKKVDFSKPYYSSGLRLLVRASNNTIHSIQNLGGEKVATETGTTAYNYLKAHAPKAQTVLFPASNQMYMALMNHNVNAVLFDEPSIAYFIKKKGQGRVKTVGPLYHGEFYGMAFPAGSLLRQKVNAALVTIADNGTLAKLYQKWFDKNPPDDLMNAIH